MFTLTDSLHFVKEVDYKEAVSYGKNSFFKKQKYLIHHYTAGRSFESSLERFTKDPLAKASAHFLIGREGQAVQLVPLNRPAWHAGSDSSWKPADQVFSDVHLNFYSIGIEIDNHGPLAFVAGKGWTTWYGAPVPSGEVVEVDPAMPGAFNRRYWHAFTQDQIEPVLVLSVALVRGLGLVDILGHSDIAPGRKQDPGPAWPLAHIQSLVFGRE